jgi:hypothetical protein
MLKLSYYSSLIYHGTFHYIDHILNFIVLSFMMNSTIKIIQNFFFFFLVHELIEQTL